MNPNQSRLPAAFLPVPETASIQAPGVLQATGDATTDLQDLFVLACRVTGHAVALTSTTFRLPAWLVIDALDPATARGIPDYV